jgi:hypothetical protein
MNEGHQIANHMRNDELSLVTSLFPGLPMIEIHGLFHKSTIPQAIQDKSIGIARSSCWNNVCRMHDQGPCGPTTNISENMH